MWFLVACHPRPEVVEACADADAPIAADDASAGFTPEAVISSLTPGRDALWGSDDEALHFAYTVDAADLALVERTDGADGGCPRTGTFLRLPVELMVEGEDWDGTWSGVIEAWSLEDADLDLDVGYADTFTLGASLESEALDWSDAEDAHIDGWSFWLTGNVAAGELRIDVEVTWSGGDTGDSGDDSVSIRDGDWTTADI